MKKILLGAIIATVFTSHVNAQKAPQPAAPHKDTVVLLASKTEAITLDGMTISIAEIGQYIAAKKAGATPLYVFDEWVSRVFTYLRTSRNSEITDVEMDSLKEPLVARLRLLQQQQNRPK